MDIHTHETTHDIPVGHHEARSEKFQKISFVIFVVILSLLPFAFFPDSYAPFEITKTMLAVGGVLLSSICLSVAMISQKSLKISLHPLSLSLCGVLIVTLVSGLLSDSVWKSLVGQGFETGTVGYLTLMSIVACLAGYFVIKKQERVLNIYTALLGASALVSLVHIVRLFTGPETFTLGILYTRTSSLVGSWDDLGMFAGVAFLLSYMWMRYMTLQKGLYILLSLSFLVTGWIVYVVNFNMLWLALGCAFLALSIYDIVRLRTPGTFKKVIIIPVLCTVVCMFMALQSDRIAGFVQKAFSIQPSHVSLSWYTNFIIAKNTLTESPFFGAGPNRFTNEYLRFKPADINTTNFWNIEFPTGSGFIPTTLVTGGLIGFLAWMAFLALYGMEGVRHLRTLQQAPEQKHLHFMLLSSYISGLFLWILNIVDTPSHVILFLTFMFTGIFISSSLRAGSVTYREMNVSARPFTIAFFVLCIVFLAVYGKKALALSYFKSGINTLRSAGDENINQAETYFKKALKFDESDVYYQALSEVTIMKITSRATSSDKKRASGVSDEVSSLISSATDATHKAISIDPTNYYNYVSQARISEVGTSVDVEGSYEVARDNYIQALSYNPKSPSLYLRLARFEASQKHVEEAMKYIGIALTLKPDYTEAIFLLSQIQVMQGKIEEAITSVQYTLHINPENPLLHFQLGLLYYNDKQYQLASESFTRAVELNPSYANARYFLGLTFARLGRNPDAIAQFEKILTLHPESGEVALIISNLTAGKSPLADAQPPLDTTPEKRGTLPLQDTSMHDTSSSEDIQ